MPHRHDDPAAGPPDCVLRGSIDQGPVDKIVPVWPLLFATLGTIAAVAVFIRGSGLPIDEVQVTIVVTLTLLAILIGLLLRGRYGRRLELQIFADRIVVELSTALKLTILHRDMQSVSMDRTRIRVVQTSGRRFVFRGSRLHVEDAFDVLSQRVEAVNPECQVEPASR